MTQRMMIVEPMRTMLEKHEVGMMVTMLLLHFLYFLLVEIDQDTMCAVVKADFYNYKLTKDYTLLTKIYGKRNY